MADPSFVFQGTILKMRDSTVALVEADDLTARVRVDRVIRAPEAMEQLAGREITVRLRQAASEGERATFSADGWLYGESLAVVESGDRQEVGTPPRGVIAEVLDQTGDALEHPAARDRAASFRSSLQARAAEASKVVVGRVLTVGPAATGAWAAAAAPEGQGRLSEHSAQWTEATVEVQATVKGRAAKVIKVLFANSQDVMWRDAPKLAVGQKAVLLLHRAPAEAGRRADAVLRDLDVQPADSAEVVASLL